jgi:hypothetical protein
MPQEEIIITGTRCRIAMFTDLDSRFFRSLIRLLKKSINRLNLGASLANSAFFNSPRTLPYTRLPENYGAVDQSSVQSPGAYSTYPGTTGVDEATRLLAAQTLGSSSTAQASDSLPRGTDSCRALAIALISETTADWA